MNVKATAHKEVVKLLVWQVKLSSWNSKLRRWKPVVMKFGSDTTTTMETAGGNGPSAVARHAYTESVDRMHRVMTTLAIV